MDFLSSSRSHYLAKLLLFGEFTIIEGGKALSTVIDRFQAQWKLGQKDLRLVPFFDYLLQFDFLNEEKIKFASSCDLFFNSSIPLGSGLGSSGCVTAAAYDIFKNDRVDDPIVLKRRLAQMESFFHGKSSGVDPLTVYLDAAILVDDDKITKEQIALKNFYLLDSMQERNSKAMIETFYKKKEHKDFNRVLDTLDQFNNKAIDLLLQSRTEELLEIMLKISALQWEHFHEMITDNIKAIWQEGLFSKKYAIKLSGAGGGGFYLAFGQRGHEQFIKLS